MVARHYKRTWVARVTKMRDFVTTIISGTAKDMLQRNSKYILCLLNVVFNGANKCVRSRTTGLLVFVKCMFLSANFDWLIEKRDTISTAEIRQSNKSKHNCLCHSTLFSTYAGTVLYAKRIQPNLNGLGFLTEKTTHSHYFFANLVEDRRRPSYPPELLLPSPLSAQPPAPLSSPATMISLFRQGKYWCAARVRNEWWCSDRHLTSILPSLASFHRPRSSQFRTATLRLALLCILGRVALVASGGGSSTRGGNSSVRSLSALSQQNLALLNRPSSLSYPNSPAPRRRSHITGYVMSFACASD